jgi:predicted membrane protein DUF2238
MRGSRAGAGMSITPRAEDRGHPSAVRAHPVIAAWTVAYIGAFGVYCAAEGIRQFWIYLGVMAVLMALVAWVDRRVGLGSGMLAAMSVWGLAHMAGGLIPVERVGQVLYNVVLIPHVLRYDQAVHAFGFGTAAAICRRVLEVRAPGLPPGTTAAVVWLMGMGLGALNEVVEFVATLVQPASNVGGYHNTAFDLVFNMLGSGAVAVWAYRMAATAQESR